MNSLIILTFLFLIIVFIGNYFFSKFVPILYSKDHAIHKEKVIRIGGLLVYLNLFIFTYFYDLTNYFLIFYLSIPMVIVCFLEDIFGTISIRLRLLSIILSVTLLVFFSFPISYLDIPLYYNLNKNYIFLFFITLVSYAAIINFLNFIDGMNGLCLFSVLFICIALITHSGSSALSLHDSFFLYGLIIVITTLLPWNFPYQKIFIGDTGSYFLGLLLGYAIINFMNHNENIPSFSAVLLIIYPFFEGLFSLLRRLVKGKKIYNADNLHLHSLIYKRILNFFSEKTANNITTIFLFPFCLFGPIGFVLFSHNINAILILITLFIFFYVITYYFLHKSSKKIL